MSLMNEEVYMQEPEIVTDHDAPPEPRTEERPNFLPDKFKTVDDFVKSYTELEKKLSAQHVAPKEYDFSKGAGWIEADYEPFQEMAKVARSKNVPQEVMDTFLESVGYYLDEFKTDVAEEKAKLGEKASERIQVLNNWAKNNLSDKSFAALTAGMRTAEQIEALEEIRSIALNQSTIVPTGAETSNPGDNMEKYRTDLRENYDKYKKDNGYRKQMNERLEKIVGRD